MLLFILLFNKIHFPPPRRPAVVFLGASAWRFPVFSTSFALREPSPPTGRICRPLRLQQPPLHAHPLLLRSSDGSLPGGFNQEIVYKSLFKGSWGAGPLVVGHQGSSWAFPPIAQVSSAFTGHTFGLPSNQVAPSLGTYSPSTPPVSVRVSGVSP